MTHTPLRLTVTAVAAAALIGTAGVATATPPAAAPRPAPVAADEGGTGSAMADSGSAAAQSAVGAVRNGDVIGVLVLLALTPFQMLTGGVCDLASFSALPNPCAPSTY